MSQHLFGSPVEAASQEELLIELHGLPPKLVENSVRYRVPRMAVILDPIFKKHLLPLTYEKSPHLFWRPPVYYLKLHMENMLSPIFEKRNQMP